MPIRIDYKEPVEYYSNLEAGLDLSSPLNLNQNTTPLNLNQDTAPLNLNQPRSHAETFLDLYQSSPTTKDYNINVNADLANRISEGLGSVPYVGGALSTMADVAMPAAAFIGSPFYDAIQGTYRGITDPDKSVRQAIKDENIGSTMWERMIGASAPLSERLSNWKDTLGTYGKAFAGDYLPKTDDDGWTIYPDSPITGQNIQRPNITKLIQMSRRRQQLQDFKNIEAKTAAAAAAKAKADAAAQAQAQASQRQADQARISRAYREETGGQAGSYAPGGGSGAHAADASGSTYSDPFDPGGGEARGGFIDGTNRRRNYLDGGLIDFFRYGGFIG